MDQVQRFLLKYYRGIGGPLAGIAERHVLAGEWAQLQELRCDPTSYTDPVEYHRNALICDIARKAMLPGDATRRREAAIATFWACEAQCKATNDRLARFQLGGPFKVHDEAVIEFITRWRKNVKRLLGRCSFALDPAFSSGSTLSHSGDRTTIPDKMSADQTAYRGLMQHPVALAFKRTPLEGPPTEARANRFFTVPKDATKDRGCCVEASWNISLQLAVGRRLKRLYRKRYRVDLSQAQPLHRELARAASECGSLATIDLSNASDTVARRLVELILPADWRELLKALRATHTSVDGKVVLLEKFSSMGNGFTFELETIIFRTMLETLGSTAAHVYGDDCIVETELAPLFIKALTFFGFQVNERKSFVTGSFRESCGGDYFAGMPVRALFMKELPDEPQKWLALANGIRRVDARGELNAAWRFCVDQLPSEWRNYGPSWLGDTVIHDEESVPTLRHWYSREYCQTEGRRIRVKHERIPQYRIMRAVPHVNPIERWDYRAATASCSFGVRSEVASRKSISGYKQSWVPAWGLNDDLVQEQYGHSHVLDLLY